MRINEDYLDNIDSQELTSGTLSEDINTQIMSPYYDFTLFLHYNVSKLNRNVIIKNTQIVKQLADAFFSDNEHSEVLTVQYKIEEDKSFKKIQNLVHDLDVYPSLDKYEKQITYEYPTVFNAFSFKKNKSLSPSALLRFAVILAKCNFEDIDIVNNKEFDESSEEFTQIGDFFENLSEYYFSDLRKSGATLNPEDTNDIGYVTYSFRDAYIMFRDVFFKEQPYPAALKAIPQFEPSVSLLMQVNNVIQRETQLRPKLIKRMKDFEMTVMLDDFKSQAMCYEFAADLTELPSLGTGHTTIEVKKLGTNFTPNHCREFTKKVYNKTFVADEVFYLKFDTLHNNIYYPTHFLFVYLGMYFEEDTRWPFYGGILLAAKTQHELEKLISAKL